MHASQINSDLRFMTQQNNKGCQWLADATAISGLLPQIALGTRLIKFVFPMVRNNGKYVH